MNYSRKSSISGASAGIPVPMQKAMGFVGTWAFTRNAAGDYSINLTAAGNSPFLVFPLDRGIRLVSMDLAYSIGTADLTTLTAAIYRRRMVSGSLVAITQLLAPTAIPKAQTTNILVTNVPVGAVIAVGQPLHPVEIGAHENDINSTDFWPDTDEWLEIAAVNPGTSVLKVYGVWLYGDKQI